MAQAAVAKPNMDIHYDPIADVLYCSFGPPQPAVGEEIDEGVIMRRDPETHLTVGITVIDFRRRFLSQPEQNVTVPLELTAESLA